MFTFVSFSRLGGMGCRRRLIATALSLSILSLSILSLSILAPSAALAGGSAPGVTVGGASGGPSVSIDPEACRQLVRYQPDPGVAYQPGVDVDGNPVAPADLNPSPALPDGGLPGPVVIPLTASLGRLLGMAQGRAQGRGDSGSLMTGRGGVYDSQAQLGVVTVDGDQVLFNGRPLDGAADAELAAACRAAGLGK